MKFLHSRLAASAVFIVVLAIAGTAFGELTAYWSFDSDLTSVAGTRIDMDGTAVTDGGTVSIGTAAGEWVVGGGGLKLDNDPSLGAKTGVLIDAPVAEVTWPITDPAVDIPVITISGWYKVADVGSNGLPSWLYMWESSAGFTTSLSINTADTDPGEDNVRWAYGAKNNFNQLVGPDSNINEWNHAVTVFNPITKRAKFYHNGVLRDYRAIPDDILMTLGESTQFYIGSARVAKATRNFDGYMDEVAVFNHEPTAEVIAGLYDGTYTPDTAPTTAATAITPNVTGWEINSTITSIARPAGMAVNPNDGKLYVACRGNNHVSSAGTVASGIYAIESDGSATAYLEPTETTGPTGPSGLVIDSSGMVFYSEDLSGNIYQVQEDELGDKIPGVWVSDFIGNGSDCDPCSMVIAPSNFDGGVGSLVQAGDALVVDFGSGGFEKIYIWSTSTSEGETVLHDDADAADGTGSPLLEPRGLAIGEDAIYVSDFEGDAIYSVDPTDGSLTELLTDRTLVAPTGMAVDPVTGNLFVMTDSHDIVGSELVSIDPDTGHVTTVMDMLVDMDDQCETWPMLTSQLLFSSDGQHLYVSEPDAGNIYDLIRLTLSVPGDTDNDGDVDADDAEVLANHWGGSTSNGASDGDFNGDGVVNAKDASILAANWGNHNESGSPSSVPEPSALVLLFTLAATTLVHRRR